MCFKGETWPLHYPCQDSIFEIDITMVMCCVLHFRIFFFKDSAGRVKKILLSIFIGVVFTYL